MPTLFWASLLLLACSSAFSGAEPELSVRGELAAPGQTRLSFSAGAQTPLRLLVSRDEHVPAQAKPGKVQVLGVVNGAVAVLIDSYPSSLVPLSNCGAGRERFLRVVRMLPAPAKETLRLKLESCRENIDLDREADGGGIRWLPETSELRLAWSAGPVSKLGPESRRLQISPDGSVKELKPV